MSFDVHWKTHIFLLPMICHVALTLFFCVAINISLEFYKAYNELYINTITIKIKIVVVFYQYSIITLNDGDTKMLVGHECMLPGIRTTIF